MPKPEPLDYAQAFHYALRLLNQRMYSQSRLAQKLQQKGASQEDIDAIIAKLVDLRFLDDHVYAQAVVRHEASLRHSSPYIIRQKLRQKGVGQATITPELLNDTGLPSDDERALYHAKRFANRHKDNAWHTLKPKLMGYLYRKGFTSKSISEAVKKLKG